jgi:hypothetical protein
LLGDADAAAGLPGLRLAADLTDAITVARNTANRPPEAATSAPIVVLHTLPVIGAADQVLRDLLGADDRGVVAVFAGPGPPGRTWIVEADGTIVHAPAATSVTAGRTRLGVVNQFAALTVVTTLQQVRRAAMPSPPRTLARSTPSQTAAVPQPAKPMDVAGRRGSWCACSAAYRSRCRSRTAVCPRAHRSPGRSADPVVPRLTPKRRQHQRPERAHPGIPWVTRKWTNGTRSDATQPILLQRLAGQAFDLPVSVARETQRLRGPGGPSWPS